MKEEGHRKHGDRTEIIETTIIPQQSQQNITQSESGSMTVSRGEPQVVSSQPLIVTDRPFDTDLGQHGTTVKKIIDKTTIEHHENKNEKLKDKAKNAAEKILGFIPNPFSHKKDEAQAEIETTGEYGPKTTITTTTTVPGEKLRPATDLGQNVFPTSQNHPQSDLPYTTKTITEFPSTGQSHLSCDKKSS